MKIKITTLLCFVTLTFSFLNAQDVKFGKISKKELQEKFYPEDTAANAVVLYKKRRSVVEYNNTVGWELITTIHERIKIYNQEGFNIASKSVRLYTQAGKEEEFSVKGYTYNLENGKINKTKLEKNAMFKEDINKNWFREKFTMPNLKEGSVVEWKYEIRSAYIGNITDVIAQYKIPIKQFEAYIAIPEYFRFKYLPSRYYPINVKQSKEAKTYRIPVKSRSDSNIPGGAGSTTGYNQLDIMQYTYKTNLKNIPALKNEPYLNSINNYVAKIAFEYTSYQPKNGIPKFYNNTWKDVTKSIYDSQYFGEQLARKGYFKKDLDKITANISGQNETILAVFEYVKNHMKWNNYYGIYVKLAGIRDAYEKREGNVAEINLILTAMLREAGIKANPILVSTRKHGIPIVPTKEGFNYVITGVEMNDKVILLDATEKYSMPDVLPLRALNWEGRLLRKDGTSISVNLYPNKYNSKRVNVRATLDIDGAITGYIRTTYDKLNALDYRTEYNHLAEDELISNVEENIGNIEIEKIKLNNKKNVYKPLIESVQFVSENQVDVINDKIFIPPMLFYTENENPFKQEERNFPVDFGAPWKDEIAIDLKLPEGYQITSKPENTTIELPDGIGSFSFELSTNDKSVKVITKTKINTPIVSQTYYKSLQDFYKKAIEKQLEKIVITNKAS